MKQSHKFFSPLQERWKTTLLFTFGVQHVIEEFIPHLRQNDDYRYLGDIFFVYLDLPPSPESSLDDPPIPRSGDLDILAKEEAVGTARDTEVVQVIFPGPPLGRRVNLSAVSVLRLHTQVDGLPEVNELQTGLSPGARFCKKETKKESTHLVAGLCRTRKLSGLMSAWTILVL